MTKLSKHGLVKLLLPKLSDLNAVKNRFTYSPQADDLEIVAFHRMGEVKSNNFLIPDVSG